MITDVDTTILLDVLVPGAPRQQDSRDALAAATNDGALIIGEAVYAELAAHFASDAVLDAFLSDTGLKLVPSAPRTLSQAGRAWREYRRQRPVQLTCPQCGAPQDVRCARCGRAITARRHVVADFLIGAHAAAHADRLLTRPRLLRHVLPVAAVDALTARPPERRARRHGAVSRRPAALHGKLADSGMR